jgi:hypothetical protein
MESQEKALAIFSFAFSSETEDDNVKAGNKHDTTNINQDSRNSLIENMFTMRTPEHLTMHCFKRSTQVGIIQTTVLSIHNTETH